VEEYKIEEKNFVVVMVTKVGGISLLALRSQSLIVRHSNNKMEQPVVSNLSYGISYILILC
jgi:hypothetical protein